MAPVDARVIEPEIPPSVAAFPSPAAVPVVSAAVAAPVMLLVLVMLIFPDVPLAAVPVAASARPVVRFAASDTGPPPAFSVMLPLIALSPAPPLVVEPPVVISPLAFEVMLVPVTLIDPDVTSLLPAAPEDVVPVV